MPIFRSRRRLINGTVNGDIIATEKIELGRTARIAGNIQTPRMTMDEGALIEGGISMIQARETAEKRNADINSRYAAATEPERTLTRKSTNSKPPKPTMTDEYSLTAANDDDDDDDDETAEAAAN